MSESASQPDGFMFDEAVNLVGREFFTDYNANAAFFFDGLELHYLDDFRLENAQQIASLMFYESDVPYSWRIESFVCGAALALYVIDASSLPAPIKMTLAGRPNIDRLGNYPSEENTSLLTEYCQSGMEAGSDFEPLVELLASKYRRTSNNHHLSEDLKAGFGYIMHQLADHNVRS